MLGDEVSLPRLHPGNCHVIHQQKPSTGSGTCSPKTAYMSRGKYQRQSADDAPKSMRATPAPVGSTWVYRSPYFELRRLGPPSGSFATAKAHSLIASEISMVRSFPSPLLPPRSIGTPFLSPATTSSG